MFYAGDDMNVLVSDCCSIACSRMRIDTLVNETTTQINKSFLIMTLQLPTKKMKKRARLAQNSDGEIVSGSSPFGSLPEECISNIISLTSPRDACVVPLVSKTFESAANSDIVWDKFLQQVEYPSLLSPSRVFATKKECYIALCDHVLYDDEKKSLWLEKDSGNKCIMLFAMNLSIARGDFPDYWKWVQIPESRFEKVVELVQVWLFEIRGRVNTRVLFPRTRYAAYLVFKKAIIFYGFDDGPIEARVRVVRGQEASRRFICFDADTKVRGDGWMEIEIGEFFNENNDEIEMSVLDMKRHRYEKSGLIIQGIEIRPSR